MKRFLPASIPDKLTGFLTNSNGYAGKAEINDGKNETKGMMEFEPASPFAKKLKLHYHRLDEGEREEGIIEIDYNTNKAIKAEMKQKICKSIQGDGGAIPSNRCRELIPEK